MIVVLSCHHYPDDERVYYRELLTLKKLGCPILYYTRSEIEMDMSDEVIIHKNFSPKFFPINKYLNTIKKELEVQPPTLIHFHEYHLLSLAKHVKCSYSAKVIYDVHEDIRYLGKTFSKRNPLFKNMLISMKTFKERYYLKFVDRVILINPIMKKCIFKEWGFEPLILQGFPSKSSVFNYPNNGCRGHTILYHGHLSPERGIHELIESIPIIRKKFPDVNLVLLGSFRLSDFEKNMHKIVKSKGLTNNIQFIPQVPHKDVWRYLKNAAIGVIPFKKNPLTINNTPTKLFEYMAAGCGIVATDLPPIRHHVSNSIQWSKPDSSESIAEGVIALFEDAVLLDNQTKENKNLILDKYNWESITGDLIALYKNLLQ